MQNKFSTKIEKAMDSLEGIDKASPGPYFFTRLEARLHNNRNFWEGISSFIARPIVVFGCISLVLMINSAVLLSSPNRDSSDQQGNEIATVDEYDQVSSTFFDLVNTAP